MPTATTLSFLGGSPGAGEMIVIFVAVLLLFGSKNLPRIARSLGRAMEEFRKAAREVSGEIMRGDRERPDVAGTKPSLPPPAAEKKKASDDKAG